MTNVIDGRAGHLVERGGLDLGRGGVVERRATGTVARLGHLVGGGVGLGRGRCVVGRARRAWLQERAAAEADERGDTQRGGNEKTGRQTRSCHDKKGAGPVCEKRPAFL
ncbi:MAG: hypothetical protein QOF21_3042 [Actinomycetota bacterium]